MDYTTKKFDETNTGILFENTEKWELAKQGKLNVDGEEFRIKTSSNIDKNHSQISFSKKNVYFFDSNKNRIKKVVSSQPTKFKKGTP